jgi:hypothetical protein
MRNPARLLLGLVIVAAAGCQQQAAAPKADTRPPAKVALPPVPPPEACDLVEKNAAGNLTAAGLRKHRTELFGQPVVVEGRVVEAYRCGAKEGCLPPHFSLADLNRPDLTLLVTGFDRDAEAGLKEGSVVLVTGSLQKAVDGFTLSEEGVISGATFAAAPAK